MGGARPHAPPSEPPFVGLTGGLGAGKSTALELLRELGAATLSSDAVVHELLERADVARAIAERFGSGVLRDGRVDRAALAARVFHDPAARRQLEELLWPLVGEEIAAWRARALAAVPPPRALVVEVPLLFEAGLETAFDTTVAIVTDDAVRRARIADRDQVALAERERQQLTQEEKAARADHVVRNDGSREALRDQLSALLAKIAPWPAPR